LYSECIIGLLNNDEVYFVYPCLYFYPIWWKLATCFPLYFGNLLKIKWIDHLPQQLKLSLVQILVQLNENNYLLAPIPRLRPGGTFTWLECWNIKWIAHLPQQLKLLDWIGQCMQLNSYSFLSEQHQENDKFWWSATYLVEFWQIYKSPLRKLATCQIFDWACHT